jgi:hypothetical protein
MNMRRAAKRDAQTRPTRGWLQPTAILALLLLLLRVLPLTRYSLSTECFRAESTISLPREFYIRAIAAAYVNKLTHATIYLDLVIDSSGYGDPNSASSLICILRVTTNAD